jgi:hypothetical protein
MTHRRLAFALMLAILAFVGAMYWPVQHGAFVWDDIVCLSDEAWFRQDGAWKSFFFRDFCGLTNYFRPTAVALFLFELRMFDADPAPMHIVSLLIHLANTLLVGCLAAAIFRERNIARGKTLACISMLLYGLHPALVEPVAWISAQTELIVTFFMLLGLHLNVTLSRNSTRAFAVSACFFTAACSKESAVAFPLVLALCDWMRVPDPAPSRMADIASLWRRQWKTYLGVLAAGIAYLALRHHALGYVLNAADHSSLSPFARFQEACFAYLAYWRMLVWPMIGLGPVHLIDERQFASVSAISLLVDVSAVAIVICGGIAWWKRKAIGSLVSVVTALLLPVLHIVPVTFDESLYHDRYAMAPLAFAAAILPGALAAVAQTGAATRRWAAAAIALLLWLAIGVINIRVTLPLWANNIALWQWALRSNPESVSARENLFAAYVMQDDPRAQEFARSMVADTSPCSTCLLSVAYFGMREHALDLSSAALSRLRASGNLQHDARLLHAFDVTSARLFELMGNRTDAEAAYREAIAADPQEPLAPLELAELLAREGRVSEAQSIEESALSLFAPEERAVRHQEFEQALAAPSSVTP